MPDINVRKWNGSLTTTVETAEAAPGDFAELTNFIYDESGYPVTRGGRRKFGAAITEGGLVPTINGLYHYRQSWISTQLHDWLIAYCGGTILKAEKDWTWTTLLSGLEWGLTPSFTTLRGWLIFASDSAVKAQPSYWDGNASLMVPLDAAPHGRIVASYASRLWIVDSDRPSWLWYSELYEPNGWGRDSGYIVVNPGDGCAISALVPGFGGEMIIFKDGPGGGATYRLQGMIPADFALVPLSTTIGAVSQRTVSLVGDKDVYFCSRRGIHSLQRTFQHGDLESAFIDTEVSDRWRSLPMKQKLLATAIDDYPHDTWWVSVDSDNDGLNDYCWLFNYRRMSPRNNPSVSDMDFGVSSGTVFSDSKTGRLMVVTGTSGQAWIEHNPEAVDETNTSFAWKARLQPIDAGENFGLKGWEKAWIEHDSWGYGTATASWWGDNHDPEEASMMLDPSSLPVPYTGGTRLASMRLPEASSPAVTLLHMRESGVRFNLSLVGAYGRIRLKALRLSFLTGREDVTAPRWFAYNRAMGS